MQSTNAGNVAEGIGTRGIAKLSSIRHGTDPYTIEHDPDDAAEHDIPNVTRERFTPAARRTCQRLFRLSAVIGRGKTMNTRVGKPLFGAAFAAPVSIKICRLGALLFQERQPDQTRSK